MTTAYDAIVKVAGPLIGKRFPLEDEKATQTAIADVLSAGSLPYAREERIEGGIIDFLVRVSFPEPHLLVSVGVEVKIKGRPADVLRQLKRYAEEPKIDALLLVTARPFKLPRALGCKPVADLNLAVAWL